MNLISRTYNSWLLMLLIYFVEQVERGAGSSGKTEKTQVNKPRHIKEDTDSEGSDFWMLSSGSESEQESDEGNCKGCSLFSCFFSVPFSSHFETL